MKTFLYRLGHYIDCATELIGKYVAWLVLVLVCLVGYDVTMRYFFKSGSIGLQELQWHLFSIIFLIGAAYTLKHDEHVRLDILYRSRWFSDTTRAWLDVLGTCVILIPFCVLVIITAWPFVQQAYISGETSPDPGGLPARWLIKSMIQLGFSLLVLQGVAEVIKKVRIALDKDQ